MDADNVDFILFILSNATSLLTPSQVHLPSLSIIQLRSVAVIQWIVPGVVHSALVCAQFP